MGASPRRVAAAAGSGGGLAHQPAARRARRHAWHVFKPSGRSPRPPDHRQPAADRARDRWFLRHAARHPTRGHRHTNRSHDRSRTITGEKVGFARLLPYAPKFAPRRQNPPAHAVTLPRFFSTGREIFKSWAVAGLRKQKTGPHLRVWGCRKGLNVLVRDEPNASPNGHLVGRVRLCCRWSGAYGWWGAGAIDAGQRLPNICSTDRCGIERVARLV